MTGAQVHAAMLRLVAKALRHPDPVRGAEILEEAARELEQVK